MHRCRLDQWDIHVNQNRCLHLSIHWGQCVRLERVVLRQPRHCHRLCPGIHQHDGDDYSWGRCFFVQRFDNSLRGLLFFRSGQPLEYSIPWPNHVKPRLRSRWLQLNSIGEMPYLIKCRCGQSASFENFPHTCDCGTTFEDPWTPDMPARGLGDRFAKVTHAMRIKPCGGCKKRQARLNAAFPIDQGKAVE